METHTTLVRANGVVELHTVAQVGLHLALVVYPGHAESENAVGLDHALNDFSFLELGMLVVLVLHGEQDFAHSLQVFFLARVLCLKIG